MSDTAKYVGTPATVSWLSPAAGEASLTVTGPDGVELDPAPAVTDSSAQHDATFTPELPGRYLLHWSTPADAFVNILDVWPLTPRFLVSREQALQRLRQVDNSAGTELDALMLYIAAASAVVEFHTGPLFTSSETWTEVSAYGQRAVVLPNHDVTVTAVSVDGTALSEGAYTVDEEPGIVWVDVGRGAKVSVSYTVGSQQVPVAAQLACLEIMAHSWQQTHQGVVGYNADGTQTVTTSMGYAIPKRALEWIHAVPGAAGVA
ncbi:hypothetical protein LGT39_12440 [Demequina sp. TTPB684]|uniref:hypothetical protein n=1 Tax=unclassified Demequina TaxID=2620311 RepID=UPI001CF23A81|nr:MULTISPECIES: hypothetical protein [unclassified Demequina]MCB2413653.1 hypothetical protein [Demequina sp. TTPB684]UPU87716.1 hypothetical protein LGT36_010695 [Demequina sp. TMPB413]